VIVKGDVDEGVVGEAKDQVAHVVGLRSRQLLEDGLDPPLILVGVLGAAGGVPRYQSLLHTGFPLSLRAVQIFKSTTFNH
jgi:hypothetical protein